MLNLKIQNVSVKGISTVVPKTEKRLEDDETLYEGNKKRLKRVMASTGFCARRIVDEKTTSSDLCVRAAENLFKEMNYNKNKIDAVVFVTQTPDYHIPATSCIIQERLGLSQDIAAFDVNQGCAGYVYGLWVASSLIQSGTKSVLLLVGDTSSKYTDMFKNGSVPIFGDAGSATILEYDDTATPIYFNIGTDGSGYEVIFAKNGGFRNIPTPDKFYDNGGFKYESQMDGSKVMEFTIDKIPPSIKCVIENANENIQNIDYFIMHQANKFILENLAMNSDIPMDKMPTETLSKYGNQSCTSIPSAICDQISDIVSTKKVKLLLSGFGIGLTWASCVVDLNKICCLEIKEY
ncbi:MAG: 3-oxoacyl-ACP synthase III family protein [Candidatus Gastranaerophilaceae bacterium]